MICGEPGCRKKAMFVRRITTEGRHKGKLKVCGGKEHTLCYKHHNSQWQKVQARRLARRENDSKIIN